MIRVLLERWLLEECRLGVLLGSSVDYSEDLRDRVCRVCLEVFVRGFADYVFWVGGR